MFEIGLNNMQRYVKTGVMIAAIIIAAAISPLFQRANAQVVFLAPIDTSGDKNVYVTWVSNETGCIRNQIP